MFTQIPKYLTDKEELWLINIIKTILPEHAISVVASSLAISEPNSKPGHEPKQYDIKDYDTMLELIDDIFLWHVPT